MTAIRVPVFGYRQVWGGEMKAEVNDLPRRHLAMKGTKRLDERLGRFR